METNFNEEIILDKIKKLIALSESPNEMEAASALNKVKVLLAKYGLEYSNIKEANENLIEKELFKDNIIYDWQIKLIECINSSTFTEAIIETNEREKKINIIGRKANVTTAINLYQYLDSTIYRISIKYKIVVRDLESFRLGMVDNIKNRLMETENKPSKTKRNEIIPLMSKETEYENNTYIMNKYGKIKNKEYNKSFEENSFGLGKKVGDKISLDKQIKRDNNN